MFYASFLSETLFFSDEFMEWGISPKNFAFVNKKRFDELKDIKSNFYETSDLSRTAFQMIIDENLFNAFVHTLTSVEKMFSLRDLMGIIPSLSYGK